MDVRLGKLLAAQDDIVAVWQLAAIDWSRHRVRHEVRDGAWRLVHDGVYATCHGVLTQRQRWVAAVLTAPGTFLNARSGGACHGFWPWEGSYETVVRAGSGGPRRYPGLLVARSTTLDGQTTRKDGLPVVSAPRALIDLAPELLDWQLGKAFREAIRLRCTTANEISRALAGQRGTSFLAALCDRYATIPYHRCRSDAESRGLEILHDAGVPPPLVNVRVNGPRPDYYWPQRKFIIEIDGPDFHRFADEDARKQAKWQAAGNTVARISSQDVYDHPERLISLANVPISRL
jgi:hypothetical protein